MTDRTEPAEATPSADEPPPGEPPPDEYRWTGEPEDPDVAGMPGEFVSEPDDAVPGVRSGTRPPPETEFDQESNN